jgi:putative peptidoglycan lipid II flippase
VEAYGVLSRAVRLMLVATFAAQVCMTLVGFEAAYLIWGLFGSRFSVADAQATGTVLLYLCLGLGGWAAQTVISRGFYALGRTWLPTIVGTIIAFVMVPFYVVLRQIWGTVGLAIASSVAILVYVFLLGWLQYRRFEHEAAARGTTLRDVPGMLNGALRLAVAAGVAIAIGLAVRAQLLELVPGVHLTAILIRATVLCAVGISIYAGFARILGVRELIEIEVMLLRKLKLRPPP